MDNNERIISLLERIANSLDSKSTFANMTYTPTVTVSQPIFKGCGKSLLFGEEEIMDLFSYVSDVCDDFGFCTLAQVKEHFEKGTGVCFSEFKEGWKSEKDLSFSVEPGASLRLDCSNLAKKE